jgi:hypothetical protein
VIDSKVRDSRCFGLAKGEMAAQKRKAGASSRTPYVVVYENKLTTKLKEIKENLRKKRNAKGHQFALGEGVVIQAAGNLAGG